MKNKSNPVKKNEAIKQGRGDKTTKGFESVPYGPSKDITIKPTTSKDTQINGGAKQDKRKSLKEQSLSKSNKKK